MSPILEEGELESDYNNGIWDQEPWFLREEYEDLFSQTGFPLELRKRAVASLRRVYPPDVCRDMLQRSWGDGGVIFSLFRKYLPERLIPLLKLGLDLETVSPNWDSPLVKALRSRQHYRATEFEFGVWANLKRYGYDFVREPRVEANKKPDFLIYLDRRRYVLELKTLGRSELDQLAWEVGHAFTSVSDLMAPHCLTTVKPSPVYLEKFKSPQARAQVLDELPRIVQAFRQHAEDVRAAGFVLGRYPVEPYGYFEITPAHYKQGAFECGFVPELSPHLRAVKLMNAIKDAGKQLPSDAAGIILIDIGSMSGVEFLETQIRVKEHQNPRLFRNCNLVLLRGADSGTAVMTMGQHRLTPAEERLVEVLTHGVSQDWLRIPERWRSVYAGRMELKPGESASIKINLDEL